MKPVAPRYVKKEAKPTKAVARELVRMRVVKGAAKRVFVASVVSVEPSPEVAERLVQLTDRTKRAKKADFLVRYRVAGA